MPPGRSEKTCSPKPKHEETPAVIRLAAGLLQPVGGVGGGEQRRPPFPPGAPDRD
jgi:hypothetical protein